MVCVKFQLVATNPRARVLTQDTQTCELSSPYGLVSLKPDASSEL